MANWKEFIFQDEFRKQLLYANPKDKLIWVIIFVSLFVALYFLFGYSGMVPIAIYAFISALAAKPVWQLIAKKGKKRKDDEERKEKR